MALSGFPLPDEATGRDPAGRDRPARDALRRLARRGDGQGPQGRARRAGRRRAQVAEVRARRGRGRPGRLRHSGAGRAAGDGSRTRVGGGPQERSAGPRALDGLDLRVTTGEVHGLLGPNGAGKTTTIRVLLGLLRADAGTVRLLGGDPWREGPELHRRLAYVPGDVTLWPTLSGGEVIDLLGRLRGDLEPARRDALLERFDLDPTKKGRAYSKGNRQKVALVAALASTAELLILDEPTAGLDPLMEAAFRECVAEIRAEGRTVLLSSHILAEVEAVCDRVSIIRSGRTVETGTLAELRHLRRTSISAELAAEPHGLGALAGVHDLRVDGRAVRFEVDDDGLRRSPAGARCGRRGHAHEPGRRPSRSSSCGTTRRRRTKAHRTRAERGHGGGARPPAQPTRRERVHRHMGACPSRAAAATGSSCRCGSSCSSPSPHSRPRRPSTSTRPSHRACVVAQGANSAPSLVALYGRIYDPESLGALALWKMAGTGTAMVGVLVLVVVDPSHARRGGEGAPRAGRGGGGRPPRGPDRRPRRRRRRERLARAGDGGRARRRRAPGRELARLRPRLGGGGRRRSPPSPPSPRR